MRLHLITACVASILLLTSCSGDGEDNSDDDNAKGKPGVRTTEIFGEETPFCSDLWQPGQTVPEDYAGCYDEHKETVMVTFTHDCDDGRIFVSHPPGYGFMGEEVHVTPEGLDEPDTNSAEYKKAYEACRPA